MFQQWVTDPPTWQAFADAVRTVNTVTDAEYGFTFQAGAYEGLSCCTFAEFMSSWGGAYFGNPARYLFRPVGERPITVAEQPALDAIRMIRAFVHGPQESKAISAQVHAALADDISPSNAMSALTEQLRQIEQSV